MAKKEQNIDTILEKWTTEALEVGTRIHVKHAIASAATEIIKYRIKCGF